MEEKGHMSRGYTSLCWRAAAALLNTSSTESLDCSTAAANSIFSRWLGLIIGIEMPTARFLFLQEQVRSRHTRCSSLFDTVSCTNYNGALVLVPRPERDENLLARLNVGGVERRNNYLV